MTDIAKYQEGKVLMGASGVEKCAVRTLLLQSWTHYSSETGLIRRFFVTKPLIVVETGFLSVSPILNPQT